MEEDLIAYLKTFQLEAYIDREKVELETNTRLNQFIDLLLENILFLWTLYQNRKGFRKIVIPKQSDANLENLLNKLLRFQTSDYIQELYNLIRQQFEYSLNDEKQYQNIIKFLNICRNKKLLKILDDRVCYCINCKQYFITNKKFPRCLCGDNFIIFHFAYLSDLIKKSIQNGHILEHLVLNFLKTKKVVLIGLSFKNQKIYTSIQYKGIGADGKNNAEFDILYLVKNTLVFVECKFNQTTFSEVKDFLVASDNLYREVKEKFEDLTYYRLIVSFDSSKLAIPKNIENMRVIDILREGLYDSCFSNLLAEN